MNNNYDVNKKDEFDEFIGGYKNNLEDTNKNYDVNKIDEFDEFIDGYKNNKEEFFKEKNIEYYEVLSDLHTLWVSVENLKKLIGGLKKAGIKEEELSMFRFQPDDYSVYGKMYYIVDESFIKFVYDNTNNPKYAPIFSQFKQRVKRYGHMGDDRDVRENLQPSR